MRTLKSLIASSAVLVVALSFGVSATALARHGTNESENDVSATSNVSSSETHSSIDSTEHNSGGNKTETETEIHHTASTDNTAESSDDDRSQTKLHEHGATMLKEMKAKKTSNKSDAQLKTVCQNHQDGVNGKTTGLLKSSNRILNNINRVYDKAQAYQQKNNLQAAGYQDLIATADLAKAQATTSVNNQAQLVPTLHCDDIATTTSDLSSYKAAVQQARDDLKAYRDAVKNVLKALETSKSDSASTEGTN